MRFAIIAAATLARAFPPRLRLLTVARVCKSCRGIVSDESTMGLRGVPTIGYSCQWQAEDDSGFSRRRIEISNRALLMVMGMTRRYFQPVPINSHVQLFPPDAFDCTYSFLIFKSSSKAGLMIFISKISTGVASIHHDILVDGHPHPHKPRPEYLVLRRRLIFAISESSLLPYMPICPTLL